MKKIKSLLFLPIILLSSCSKINELFPTLEKAKEVVKEEEKKETLTKEEVVQMINASEAYTRDELLKLIQIILQSYFDKGEIKDLLVEALKDTYSTQEVDHMINSLEGERVVESYRNGFEWYRVYSDNWVEQGGRISIDENSSKTVTLKKEMVDAKYSMQVMNNSSHTAKDSEGVITGIIVNSKQIKITAGYINPNSTNVFWEVKGFMKVEDSEVNDV